MDDFTTGGIAFSMLQGAYYGRRQLEGIDYSVMLRPAPGGWQYTIESNGAKLQRVTSRDVRDCGEQAASALEQWHAARMARR